MLKICILFTTIIIGSSCSLIKKSAIGTTASIIQDGSAEINTEANWDFFKQAAPASLKTIEGFWYADQKNEKLLAMLIKGYAGYAFGVNETDYLQDHFVDKPNSLHKKNAIWFYTKAYDYGLQFLKLKGINSDDLTPQMAEKKLPELLSKKLNDDDLIAVFYFAQAYGGLINLQKTNVSLISKLPVIKSMMDWVCHKSPNIENGSCQLFYAVYESSRPAMLGGDLEKGRELFLKYIKDYPYNLLARVSFIQYYIVPTMDDTLYAQQVEFLNKEFIYLEQAQNEGDRSKLNIKYLEHRDLNLFNSIAKKRLEIIEKHKKDIF
jgi:hypothetical protein